MKKILFRVFALSVGIGFAFISLELFLRINPKFGYIYNAFRFNNASAPQLAYFNCLRPSALLGYEYIPNSSWGNGNGINSLGLVGKEYNLKKDEGIYRILILGDSIAAQGWSAEFLEDKLNTNSTLHSKYKFEIWNAGVPSYDVRRYYLYLKYKGLSYNPDMVIIFLFMNDFGLDTNVYYKTKNGAAAFYFPVSEISKKMIPNRFLMRHSYLYRFVILRLNSYLLSRKKQGITPEEDNGRCYSKMIKEICEKHKIRLFIVIFPYLKPLDAYKDWQMSEYLVISKVVKELKIPYLNLYSLYERLLKENYPLRNMDEDDIHPSKEACQLIAGEIYQYILNNFFKKDLAR